MKKTLSFAALLSACTILYPKSINTNNEIGKKINSIEINLNSENLEIIQSSNNEFSVDINCNHEYYQPIVKQNNDKLQIIAQKKLKPLFYRCLVKLYIPKNITLDYININVTSGKIDIENLKSDDIDINVTSGCINIDSLSSTSNTSIKATSGSINLNKNNAKHANIKSSSGTIDIEDNNSEDLYIKATSGTVRIRNNESNILDICTSSGIINIEKNDSNSFNIKSTSGTVKLQLTKVPLTSSYINSTSGSIHLSIPNKQGFDFTYQTTSGIFKDKINSDNISKKSKRGTKSYFGGGTNIQAKTTSGCIELEN